MKVLILNGSARKTGNTATALHEMEKVLNNEGIETVFLEVGSKEIRGCVGCLSCKTTGKCAIDDIVNETAKLLEESDGLLVGSPVYASSINATLLALLQRLIYSNHTDKRMKVGAAMTVARREGNALSLVEIERMFIHAGMPIAPSNYWPGTYGRNPGEVLQDEEGLQTVRNLAHNMAFMMKSIELGKEKYGMPEIETGARTCFIR